MHALLAAIRARLVAVALSLPALLLAFTQGEAARLPVVATFSVIGDMLANVGGEQIDVAVIVGPGGDTELYRPTPADVATIAAARAVFLNGLNEEFEPWLEPLLRQAAFTGMKVTVTRGVRTLTMEEEHPVSGRQMPAAIDQHAWLDPHNGVVYVRNIADALARLDPANAATYRARATSYAQQIQALESWARAEMAAVPAPRRRGRSAGRWAGWHGRTAAGRPRRRPLRTGWPAPSSPRRPGPSSAPPRPAAAAGRVPAGCRRPGSWRPARAAPAG
jgi:zinc/manganese transport system substrate-binding protein